jgi:hypothetical protein
MAIFNIFSLYSHQTVAAVLVPPSKDVVISIAVEAIIQQDRIHTL